MPSCIVCLLYKISATIGDTKYEIPKYEPKTKINIIIFHLPFSHHQGQECFCYLPCCQPKENASIWIVAYWSRLLFWNNYCFAGLWGDGICLNC